ncbi:MAG TPA: acid phosphatase [Burkholderiaceae bacterium]|nr:acid phosphatase [Burkholderiaceae bacterium]
MQVLRKLRAGAAALAALLVFISGCATGPAPDAEARRAEGLKQIEYIVVIYAENRSFDHLYGLFPGAEGIAKATAGEKTQLDHDGTPLPTLPPVFVNGKPSDAFPKGLPNGPFRIDAPPVDRRWDEVLPSPIHNYYQNIEQINGGNNNKFVAMSTVGAWVMGYFDGSKMKVWKWAQQYTLADHFFMGAFGGSYLNHQWLICACTPVDTAAPSGTRAQLDEQNRLKKRPDSPPSVMNGPVSVFDGRVTPDGYTVNTSQPPYQPSGVPPAEGGDPAYADPKGGTVPPQTAKTIGDTLSAKGISWVWYAGGYNQALADGRKPPKEERTVIYSMKAGAIGFQPHHQPFNFYARFAPGTADRAEHLKDYDDMVAAIDAGTLPQVTFYKPMGRLNQHPSYADVAAGDEHIDQLLERLHRSPLWSKMVVIVTYDENGGFWDHVPPPSGPGWGDRWGPGTRIPALIISPFAKRGFVDKTSYDTTSIIKFITRRFDLELLPGARAKAGDLTSAFVF